MITSTAAAFPNNVVDLLAIQLDSIDPGGPDGKLTVVRRPLRPTDVGYIQAIGVYGSTWEPDENTFEMRGRSAPAEPTLQRYQIAVQCLVTSYDEDEGLAAHSVLSAHVRAMLYRDDGLRLALPTLSVTMHGATEKLLRWGVRDQRYLSTEIDSQHAYLSTLVVWAETETH